MDSFFHDAFFLAYHSLLSSPLRSGSFSFGSVTVSFSPYSVFVSNSSLSGSYVHYFHCDDSTIVSTHPSTAVDSTAIKGTHSQDDSRDAQCPVPRWWDWYEDDSLHSHRFYSGKPTMDDLAGLLYYPKAPVLQSKHDGSPQDSATATESDSVDSMYSYYSVSTDDSDS